MVPTQISGYSRFNMASTCNHDEEVQSTNDDAASAKRQAVQLGYWKDPYIHFFAKPCHRKPPELNRGYYARVKGVENLVTQFFKITKQKCQVINLGAGSDTSFWNLHDQGLVPLKWIELDFEAVVSRKIRIIRSKKVLLDKLKHGIVGASDTSSLLRDPFVCSCINLHVCLVLQATGVSMEPAELNSPVYHILSCDLRDLQQVEDVLNKCSISFSLPTLFICECVLVYIKSSASSELIRWIGDKFQQLFFINYEQVNMDDRFGEVMIENLMARGCSLVGVEHCRNLLSQFERFRRNGWDGADGGDMLQVYKSLPLDDIRRIEKLEFLDDQEMLTQLFSHYCIVWAHKNPPENSVDFSGISLFATT